MNDTNAKRLNSFLFFSVFFLHTKNEKLIRRIENVNLKSIELNRDISKNEELNKN